MIWPMGRLAILNSLWLAGLAARLRVWLGSFCSLLEHFIFIYLRRQGSAYLHVKELLFVRTPNRVVDAVVIANQPQGLIGVVLELHARLDRHVAVVSIDTFGDRLHRG